MYLLPALPPTDSCQAVIVLSLSLLEHMSTSSQLSPKDVWQNREAAIKRTGSSTIIQLMFFVYFVLS